MLIRKDHLSSLQKEPWLPRVRILSYEPLSSELMTNRLHLLALGAQGPSCDSLHLEHRVSSYGIAMGSSREYVVLQGSSPCKSISLQGTRSKFDLACYCTVAYAVNKLHLFKPLRLLAPVPEVGYIAIISVASRAASASA
ncbi:hypothetical protein Tco_0669685 [Tanacetum coccineum]